MVRGLYTAAAGALVAQSQADVIANNLANVDTSGFKQTLLQVQSAPEMNLYRFQTDPGQDSSKRTPGVSVAQPIGALGTGAEVYDTPAVFGQGALEHTGNDLDLAIQGNAFFATQTPQGIRYTRDGQFARDPQGYLVTMDGSRVLGHNGAIILPQGGVQVGQDGTITQNGRAIDQLRIAQFANLTALRPEGDNRFVDTGAARPTPSTASTVNQGFLEKSNANVVRSMVDLITAQRWFEANEKVIQTQDQEAGLAISAVGRSSGQ
ncbi:MAG: flagellar basal-body rod protein FlgF [Vulcanimicrobiaceae bacterium]